MDPKQIRTGLYRVTAPVDHAKPDRRTRRNWTWGVTPGDEVFVTVDSGRAYYEGDAALARLAQRREADPLILVKLSSRSGRESIMIAGHDDENERYARRVVEVLEPAPRTLGTILVDEGISERGGFLDRSPGVLAELVTSGVLTLDQIETACRAYRARFEDPDDPEMARYEAWAREHNI